MHNRAAVGARAGLLTTGEAVEHILRDARLRGVRATCALPAVRVGSEWCVRERDLEAWIEDYTARASAHWRARS